MNQIKTISKYLLAMFMIVAGTMHFVNPAFFLKIMPPYLPLHRVLVLGSGIIELLLGILLLVPQTSRLAGWGIVALLLAVFPANLYLYQHQDILPASPIIHLLRLPLQGIFILWAYHTTSEQTVYRCRKEERNNSVGRWPCQFSSCSNICIGRLGD